MPQRVSILRAELQNVDAIAPLFDAYRQFYGHASDLERARAFLRDRLANGESVILVAAGEGAYHGFTQLYPSFSSVEMRRLWILNDLFVAPAMRGQGVGQALLEHARQFALETGAYALMLETATDNFTAQRLYERLNWVRDAEFFTYYLQL